MDIVQWRSRCAHLLQNGNEREPGLQNSSNSQLLPSLEGGEHKAWLGTNRVRMCQAPGLGQVRSLKPDYEEGIVMKQQRGRKLAIGIAQLMHKQKAVRLQLSPYLPHRGEATVKTRDVTSKVLPFRDVSSPDSNSVIAGDRARSCCKRSMKPSQRGVIMPERLSDYRKSSSRCVNCDTSPTTWQSKASRKPAMIPFSSPLVKNIHISSVAKNGKRSMACKRKVQTSRAHSLGPRAGPECSLNNVASEYTPESKAQENNYGFGTTLYNRDNIHFISHLNNSISEVMKTPSNSFGKHSTRISKDRSNEHLCLANRRGKGHSSSGVDTHILPSASMKRGECPDAYGLSAANANDNTNTKAKAKVKAQAQAQAKAKAQAVRNATTTFGKRMLAPSRTNNSTTAEWNANDKHSPPIDQQLINIRAEHISEHIYNDGHIEPTFVYDQSNKAISQCQQKIEEISNAQQQDQKHDAKKSSAEVDENMKEVIVHQRVEDNEKKQRREEENTKEGHLRRALLVLHRGEIKGSAQRPQRAMVANSRAAIREALDLRRSNASTIIGDLAERTVLPEAENLSTEELGT